MDADIENLLGGSSKKKVAPPAKRLKKADQLLERLVRAQRVERDDEAPSMDMTDVFGGVTVGWLSKVFSMDPSDVKKRLADCPPLHRRKSGYVYSLPVAARYLVKPVFDVQKYLASMKPSELPTQLQKDYWAAQLARQKWEENASQLWRSEAVSEVFGDTFKTIKFTMQLWTDDLDSISSLTDEQRRILTGMVDGLQAEIYRKLVGMADAKRTPSVRTESTPADDGDDLAQFL